MCEECTYNAITLGKKLEDIKVFKLCCRQSEFKRV